MFHVLHRLGSLRGAAAPRTTRTSGRAKRSLAPLAAMPTLAASLLRGLLVATILVGAGTGATAPAHDAAAASGPTVRVLHLEGEVNAVMAGYVSSSLGQAAKDHAGAAVLEVNTPGGISTAMDDIETSLLNAPVPVAVYVAPAGARAASAGLFVSQAADVVAMAPGTNIGSAHPVTGSGGDIGGDLGQKVLNDAVARIRNLATLHHRNADWCEQAVRNSVNIGADEAVRIRVVDTEPSTLAALLETLDGRQATRTSGSDLVFHTAGATVVDRPMSAFQQLLQALIDPNVAYILMLVAIFGLIAEVSSPGAILPGVVGGLSAILALVALSTLPVNLAGVLLLGFAFLLFVADIKAQTHGILTAGGLISLLLGSAFLVNTGAVDLGIDWRVIMVATAAVAAGFLFIIRKAVRARSGLSAARASALVGSLGETRTALQPDGKVFVAGAIWPASTASGPIASGQTIRVVAQDSAQLRVEPATVRREMKED
jgi:membrane-bound serine protease (ClpP class)